jgi:hypothetical protein
MRSAVDTRGSSAAKCLEKAWGIIRRVQPCLPQVVFVILASGSRSRKGRFTGCVWRTTTIDSGHEIAISPALFNRSEDVLAILLHEAAHALLFEWGLNGGCGPDGYYHREEFRAVCKKLGLGCVFRNKRYG